MRNDTASAVSGVIYMSLAAIGLGIQAGSALASIGTGIFNSISNAKVNQQNNALAQKNYELNASNLEWNKRMADRDFEYNKQLQEKIFQREDSAVQRMVADNRAAGLSPIAGLAGASAGQALEANTPQVSTNMTAPQMSANQLTADFSSLASMGNSLVSREQYNDQNKLAMEKLGLEKDSNAVNIEQMKSRIEASRLENDFARATLEDRIYGAKLDNKRVDTLIGKTMADMEGSLITNRIKGLEEVQTAREMNEWLANSDLRDKMGKIDLDIKGQQLEEAKARVLLANLVDESGNNVNAQVALTRLSVLAEQASSLRHQNNSTFDMVEVLENSGMSRDKARVLGSVLNILGNVGKAYVGKLF